MMKLKVSQLKKLAKKHGIDDEAIAKGLVAGDDEDNTKNFIIRLIFKNALVKAAPTPARTRAEIAAEDPDAQTCVVCLGCIRPPGHEGPCMDGQLNDLIPESECCKMAAEEMERHKAMKAEIRRKMDEKAKAEEEARQKALEQARRKAAEEARKKAAEEAARRKAAEDEARRKAEEEEAQRQYEAIQRALEEERKEAEKEEARRKAAEEAAEEEARQRAKEEEARKQFEAKQKALVEEAKERQRAEAEMEMAAMDERCVQTFLECVKPYRDRIRTPLKGTILYTKHMRPCRAMGTSVDVKDSSFHCLSNFMNFLQDEGLIRLKPGLTDPVVTEIRLENCKHYTYVQRPKPKEVAESPVPASPSPWSPLAAITSTPLYAESPFKAPPLSWQ